MGGLIYAAEDGGLLHFVLISVLIAGVLAWQAGRAIAGTWRPFWIVPLYMLVLAGAARFLHYALGGEELLNLHYYIVSLIIVIAAAAMAIVRDAPNRWRCNIPGSTKKTAFSAGRRGRENPGGRLGEGNVLYPRRRSRGVNALTSFGDGSPGASASLRPEFTICCSLPPGSSARLDSA